jgi:hypothetical protein
VSVDDTNADFAATVDKYALAPISTRAASFVVPPHPAATLRTQPTPSASATRRIVTVLPLLGTEPA